MRRDQFLLVLLDPVLGSDGLDDAKDQVVVEGEGAEHLGQDEPDPGEPPEPVGCAHLGHGVAHAQGENVTEHVDLGVALVELGRAVVPHKSVDDRLGVLEHLEQIAGKKTRYQSTEIIPEYFEFF